MGRSRGFSEVARPHSRCTTRFSPRLPERSRREGLPIPSLETRRPKKPKLDPSWARPRRPSPGHSPSFSSLCRRRDMPHAGAPPSRNAGREARQEPSGSRPARGQRRGARSGRRAGALARDGSRKHKRERWPGGYAGLDPGGPASGSSPGRGRLLRSQPPSRATSASRLLPSPAFPRSPSGATRRAPPFQPARARRPRATPGGQWSRKDALVPASTSDPPTPGPLGGFPGGPFANGLDFRS